MTEPTPEQIAAYVELVESGKLVGDRHVNAVAKLRAAQAEYEAAYAATVKPARRYARAKLRRTLRKAR